MFHSKNWIHESRCETLALEHTGNDCTREKKTQIASTLLPQHSFTVLCGGYYDAVLELHESLTRMANLTDSYFFSLPFGLGYFNVFFFNWIRYAGCAMMHGTRRNEEKRKICYWNHLLMFFKVSVGLGVLGCVRVTHRNLKYAAEKLRTDMERAKENRVKMVVFSFEMVFMPAGKSNANQNTNERTSQKEKCIDRASLRAIHPKTKKIKRKQRALTARTPHTTDVDEKKCVRRVCAILRK